MLGSCAYFHVAEVGDKDIGKLNVAVRHAVCVQMQKGVPQLDKHMRRKVFRKVELSRWRTAHTDPCHVAQAAELKNQKADAAFMRSA